MPETPSMVLVTAIPADPCQFPTADLINQLSVANKQDYARLHGFELHVSSDIIDPNVTAVRSWWVLAHHRQPYAWVLLLAACNQSLSQGLHLHCRGLTGAASAWCGPWPAMTMMSHKL